MSRTLSEQRLVVFEITECITCFVEFGVPSDFLGRRRKDAKTYYCPNGHTMFFGENEETRLRRRLTETQDTLARRERALEAERRALEAERRAAIALRGQATKLRKRIANGVCPCCQRTFTNLNRHMTSKHPDYSEPT